MGFHKLTLQLQSQRLPEQAYVAWLLSTLLVQFSSASIKRQVKVRLCKLTYQLMSAFSGSSSSARLLSTLVLKYLSMSPRIVRGRFGVLLILNNWGSNSILEHSVSIVFRTGLVRTQ